MHPNSGIAVIAFMCLKELQNVPEHPRSERRHGPGPGEWMTAWAGAVVVEVTFAVAPFSSRLATVAIKFT